MFKVYDDVYVKFDSWYDGDLSANPNLNIEPVIGLGCTYLCGSDRYPYTIVEVINPKKIIVRCDTNPDFLRIISKRKDGNWKEVNSNVSFVYELGYRNYEIDRGF